MHTLSAFSLICLLGFFSCSWFACLMSKQFPRFTVAIAAALVCLLYLLYFCFIYLFFCCCYLCVFFCSRLHKLWLSIKCRLRLSQTPTANLWLCAQVVSLISCIYLWHQLLCPYLCPWCSAALPLKQLPIIELLAECQSKEFFVWLHFNWFNLKRLVYYFY